MDCLFGIEPMIDFENAVEDVLQELYTQKTILNINTNIIEAAKDDLKTLLTRNNFQINRVIDIISSRCNGDKANYIISKINEKRTDLLYGALLNYNASFGKCIIDFDWSLKIILGTSELKILQYPLLQLVLSTLDSNGVNHKMLYEFNKELLGKLINLLENME